MQFWTAGQRIDPTNWQSRFVWRVITTEVGNGIRHGDTVSEITYTNWYPGEPNNFDNREACVVLAGDRSYTWNDYNCNFMFCSVCEIDMA